MEKGFLTEGLDLFNIGRIKHVAVNVGHFIFRMPNTLASHGDHNFERQRGAEAELDSALYDQPISPLARKNMLNRWDDCGREIPDDVA